MEDNPKILKVEYLSNHLLDTTQFFTLSLNNHKRNISNPFLDHTQILNLSLDDQTISLKSSKWRQYLINHCMDRDCMGK